MTNPTTHLLLANWAPPSIQAILPSGDHVGAAVAWWGKFRVALDQLDEVARPVANLIYCLGDELDPWWRAEVALDNRDQDT